MQGADAAVAAAEVGAALAVAADLHDALTAAHLRLADHHELWLAVAARVGVLADEQRARFADAGARLAVLVGPAVDLGAPGESPEARRLVEAVAEQDAAAAGEHRALLQALTDDAAAAAAVLVAATRPLGGTGRPGDAVAVTARLAVQLPGWGAGALAALGRRAADELTGPDATGDLAAAVARWHEWASVPGFADALVERLGADGLGWLLTVLGGLAGTGEEQQLAGLLAGALSGAGARTGEVLAAFRLDPGAPGDGADGTAVAMGLVLAAPAAGPSLAVAWGRQLLDREAAQAARAGAGSTGGALLGDPVEAALAALARSGDRAGAAQLLADPGAWTTLLARPWPGGTGALAAVVQLAAAAPEAGRVARSALLALGQGLAPGSPARVLDDQGALARLRPAVTGLVAGQPGVVLPVLDAAVTGAPLDAGGDAALRGLGYLVTDEDAATELTAAVRGALQTGAAGGFAGEVAGAHVAVLEYGQRLRYALEWSQAQSWAVDLQMPWQLAVSAPLSAVPGVAGELAGAVEGVAADLLGTNGEVEIGPDTGIVRTGVDAAGFAAGALGPAAAPAARAGFDRAGALLGGLTAPQPSLLDRMTDLELPDPFRRRR